jgi:hypothetical protein
MIQIIVAMTIVILRGHDGDEHNTHQNDITIIIKAMMILILMVLTYSCSDSKKIKLIMLENNTNNLNENSIKPNINCHSLCDDQNSLLQHE